ncbi:hypothetical protein I307_02011 [Cryptococcus deuterogattii 99/473]|uniref:MARVEL domain-containing protein n=2 Tax=Cryptococcus deuterogattii TaxID=1859096 RepID=A0A0D0UYV0_9TREE|nr:hypothetical protein I309_04432 [Cryptococcus deuterogattii LA55]KIR35133.1 hypothetical protein I352_02401 [Cryptococcus deuterogattii MMRL2647]KIR40456.1 hypothetical protein I313_03781 [Cryptococcus deuterogattii Ram5]KIR72168.1 hypothetical protein I310_04221 [Cryptococcus deuterogattii CA1014]KIR93729.1 hypothetical protein I304_02404 [Cryptococcus deuterogattii CBS 10090]KIR99997.1 hypothetical protein L804_02634 [Cryptococcus deuterogattii 2001/935-1]KIY58697.1 hypothetical protein 
MPSERVIRFTHTFLFTLVLLSSIVALGISASLVGHYNSHGYPPVHTDAYRDRIRILLVASVWTTAWGLILTFGFQFFGQSNAFGLITHLVPMAIAFILYLIGVSSLTALTDKIDCGNVSQSFTRCSIVKGLVVISWIDTIFILFALTFLTILCFMARGRYGAHRSTLYLD